MRLDAARGMQGQTFILGADVHIASDDPIARFAAGSAAKRLLDVVLAGVLLIATSPLMLLAALAVKLEDGGPILFRQIRVGRGGLPFRCPKLRSMRVGAEHLHDQLLALNHHAGDVTFKARCDPRLTRVGRLLRVSSIDELPQLWCVLRGEMSIVGPRPALPREVACYGAHEQRRLSVKPGLTGIWQVNGRSHLPFARQIEMDLEYVARCSLWLDLQIIARTIPAVLTCRGAF